ncbi:hypothetical protein BKA63DRAFT_565244 [Paraphoma chrysanthemicola]|nr:hypothetical protein BKA63DRAFT_565244 [Paraphoma chrysanthemicola]
MGTRMYMRSKTVSTIFKKQKEEVGKMLSDIDEEMAKNPRTPPNGHKTIDPWVKQDLGTLWTQYMDERFATVHKRTHSDMDTYLKLLDDKWCEGRPKSRPESPAGSRLSPPIDTLENLFGALDLNDVKKKDLCRFLDKVQKEWTAEKAKPWAKPW